jgi:phosphoribosyl 1,2-cyclic phosphodiesterase
MNFIPISSSSKGNAYIVEADGVPTSLLLEAGIPIRQLKEKLGFNLSKIAGCLISHEHQDHSKAVKDLLYYGIECYMSKGTADALGVTDHHRTHLATAGWMFQVLPWRIMPFNLQHDASEPVGYLIAHGDDRLLFVPDTAYVKERFNGVTVAAIECNNIAEILSRNIQSGGIDPAAGRRIRHNHMNLETLISMLKANDLSRCRRIYLMHLSDANSDERRMKEEVQAATGIPTEIC